MLFRSTAKKEEVVKPKIEPEAKPLLEIAPERPEAIKETVLPEKRVEMPMKEIKPKVKAIIPIKEIRDELTWQTVAKKILDKWDLPTIEEIGKLNRTELTELRTKLKELPSMPLRDSGLKGLA